jgi:hypothetical protein
VGYAGWKAADCAAFGFVLRHSHRRVFLILVLILVLRS